MKNWHYPLLSIFAGVLFLTATLLVAAPPRGTAVELLPAPTPAPLAVHVAGAVNQPGVYMFERGSRLIDAVDAAGGFHANANQEAVNLAAILKDGQKVRVPAVDEVGAVPEETGSLIEETSERVNLNTASEEELLSLPGIGPTRADQIIAYRQEHGGFKSIDQILEVPGIGPSTLAQFKHLITLDE